MKRTLLLTVSATALLATLGFASPEVQVNYPRGVPQVQLSGDFPQALYTVYRASESEGPFLPISESNTLCLGPCYVQDDDAKPGGTYWYRFDLIMPNGDLVVYGPFPVEISATLASRVRATLFPNPSFGRATIELFVAGASNGAAVRASASILDLQGRKVRTLFDGALPRGSTTLSWDGAGDDGRLLRPGTYFLRFASREGSVIQRVVRIR